LKSVIGDVSEVLALQRNNLDFPDHFIMSEDKLKAQGMFLQLLFGQKRQKMASASIQQKGNCG
jgi:hypothetical protein